MKYVFLLFKSENIAECLSTCHWAKVHLSFIVIGNTQDII